jgi:hypothetical protein
MTKQPESLPPVCIGKRRNDGAIHRIRPKIGIGRKRRGIARIESPSPGSAYFHHISEGLAVLC